MARIANWEWALWYLSLGLQITVVAHLVVRGRLFVYRGLCAYLTANVLQSAVFLATYLHWGRSDFRSEHLYWIAEIPVLLMRGWAIADICRLLLAPYRGIWGLAWRLLLFLATGLVFYSVLSAGRRWDHAVLKANISLELTTVILLVVLFLFARYYGIAASPAIRALALGFLIYSSFTALNDTILQHWLAPYLPIWQRLSVLPFAVSVCLWLWAVRQPVVQTATNVSLLPRDVYRALAPEINLRLRMLNDSLSRLWDPEVDRP